MIVSLNALDLLWMEGQSFNEAVEHLAECVNFGCVWLCDQTIEELPLEFDSASGSSSNMDATGLPPAASRGNAMSPAMFSLMDGDCNAVSPRSSAGYLGSTRSSRPRRSFHSEHSLGVNGAAGSEEPTYPSIKSDKWLLVGLMKDWIPKLLIGFMKGAVLKLQNGEVNKWGGSSLCWKLVVLELLLIDSSFEFIDRRTL